VGMSARTTLAWQLVQHSVNGTKSRLQHTSPSMAKIDLGRCLCAGS
jgi:hypothetical protein